MPVMKDPLGAGSLNFRRLQIRGLSSWQLEIPGKQELLDPILQLLEFAQGDTPIWFDGAGFAEVTSPSLIWIGDAAGTTDIVLPHRYVIIASLCVYHAGTLNPGWTPLGGDGVTTCDAIRMSGIANEVPVTAMYRRKVKCVVRVEDKVTRRRVFRSQSYNSENIHSLVVTLDEVAN